MMQRVPHSPVSESYRSFAAELEPIRVRLQTWHRRKAINFLMQWTCWSAAVAAVVMAVLLKIEWPSLNFLERFVVAMLAGAIAYVAVQFFGTSKTQYTAADTAERIDRACGTFNSVASALSFSQEASTSFIDAAVIQGRHRLQTILVDPNLSDVMESSLESDRSKHPANRTVPVASLISGIICAAFISLLPSLGNALHATQVAMLSNMSGIGPAAATSREPPQPARLQSSSLPQGSPASEAAVNDARSNSSQASLAANALAHADSTANASGATPAEGLPIESTSPQRAKQASKQTAARSQSADAPQSSSAKSSGGASGSQPESAQGSPSAQKSSGQSGGGKQDDGHSQKSGADSSSSKGNPSSSEQSGQQNKSNGQGEPGASPATPSGPSQKNGDRGNSLSPSGNEQPGNGKGAASPNANKKSRGVPPLLLGERQSDTISGPLMPGPEQSSTTLSPAQRSDAVAPPVAGTAGSAVPSQSVDSFRVDAGNEQLVSDYLLALHRDDSAASSAAASAPQP